MKKLILFVVMALICATSFGQLNDKAKADIKEYAKDRWGTDYSMVKYEIDKQTQAGDEFMLMYKENNCFDKGDSDICIIFIEAYAKWSDENTGWVQWDMVLYELKKQLDAYYKVRIS